MSYGRRPPHRYDPPADGDWRSYLRDLRATVRLVWQTSPRQTVLITLLSLTQAFIPAASLWISKLLLDNVAAAVTGQLGTPAEAFRRLLTLLALQVAVGALSNLLSTIQGASRELIGDALQNHISLLILEKAAKLELEQFENADTYDTLRNAYREVGTRPLGVLTQVISLAQALITLTSVSALMARLGAAVVPLILLATLPGVWVTSRFGTAGFRMIRRQAADARVQNYLGNLLTSDHAVKEVRLFGFEGYLLERWQAYYQKFRHQLVDLITRRSGWGLAASLLSAGLIALATLSVLQRASQGLITVGDFSLFVLGIAQVQSQFSNLISGFTGIYQNLLYMRNLFEFLELPARDLDAGERWEGPIHTIELEDVTFRYPLTERDVLEGVSFRIERGQALALVGENGAGKTTLAKLPHPPLRTDQRPDTAQRPRRQPLQRPQRPAGDEHHLPGLRPVQHDRSGEHRPGPHRPARRRAQHRRGRPPRRRRRPHRRAARGLPDHAGPHVPGRHAALQRPVATPGPGPPLLPRRLGTGLRRTHRLPRRQRRI